LSRLVGR